MSAEIFEFFLRLTYQDEGISLAFQFPEKISDKTVTQSVPKFCFPEGTAIEKHVEKDKTESFSFVSTLSDGNRRFGYCRRFFKPNRPPECYCLLSFSASFSLFSQLLDIVELKFMEGDKSVYTFLHSVLAQPFPDPGQTIQAQTFHTIVRDDGQLDYLPETFRLTRSNDDYEYLEYVTYDTLFRSLDVDNIMLIFECLLSERRILLVAKTLNTLTSCMDAISNMAYPFSWQYVFIPILPKTMLSVLGAPMPFLIGILSTCLDDALKEPLEEGVLIVDIDNNEIIQAPDDLPPIMPYTATEKLRKSLKKIVASPKRFMEFSIDVAHSLLKFWTSIFGTYSKYFDVIPETSTNGHDVIPRANSTESPSSSLHTLPPVARYTFNFERFIKSKNAEVKKFLLAFKEFQLYQYFMQEREEWMKKGLINYCIILRAQNAKKKDSIAAVKAKLKSHVGRMLAAWNESHAVPSSSASSQSKKKERVGTSSSQDANGSTDSGTVKESDTSDSEITDSNQRSSTGHLNDTTTESEDRTDASSPKASTIVADTKGQDRPRAATMAPTVPPKPKTSTKKITGATAVTSTSTKSSSNNKLSSSPKDSKSQKDSKDSKSSTTPPKGGSDGVVATGSGKPIMFSSRYTFKPTPLTDGTFEKQIWKLCNVEVLSDTQIMSNEKRKYWVYSPVLFQRLPALEKIERINGCLPIPMKDHSVEALLQWVFSDEIALETAETALELLTYFPHSASNSPSTILRSAIAQAVLKGMNSDNALRYVTVFSSAKGSENDPIVNAILASAKLSIAKFSADEMNALFRRQLSSVNYITLASILHLHSSASARQEAQEIVESLLKQADNQIAPRHHLIQDLSALMADKSRCDMTLVFPKDVSASDSEETKIKVHSKIMAARSSHLSKMLGLNFSDQVKILNVSAAHFKLLLPYIYTGQLPEINDSRDAVLELVQAAHVLDMDTLSFREALYVSLNKTFTITSVFDFLDVPAAADGTLQHPAERAVLVGAAAYYIAHHPTIFYRPEKLKTLDPDVWECIFKYAYASPTSHPAITESPRTDISSSSKKSTK